MAPMLPVRVHPERGPWPLHDAASSRAAESAALAVHAPFELMARAGLAVARLALAVAQLPGSALAAWGVARWGRKPTLQLFLLMAAAGCLAFTLVQSPLAVAAASHRRGNGPRGRSGRAR